MARGFVFAPEEILPDVPYQEELGEQYSNFKFSNYSPYYVSGRYDLATLFLPEDADFILEPGSSQIITLEEPTDRLCWKVDPRYPKEFLPVGARGLFFFSASNEQIVQASSFRSVGVTTAPEAIIQASAATLANLENTDQPSGSAVYRVKADLDTALRFSMNNLGEMFSSVGAVTPSKFMTYPDDNTVRLLKTLILPTADPVNLDGAARRGFVESHVAGRIRYLGFNQLSATARPDAYPNTTTIMEVDGTAGWPERGVVVTRWIPGSSVLRIMQTHIDTFSAGNPFRWRGCVDAATWKAFK